MYLTFMSRELCLRFLMYVLVFVVCQKMGNFLFIFLIFFCYIKKKRTRSSIKNSLKKNAFNAHVKFQTWIVHSERDVHVQKIKVRKYFSNTLGTHSGY